MLIPKFRRVTTMVVVLVMLLSLFSSAAMAAPSAAPAAPVTFTILHTNDFHGQLEPSSTNPNSASNPGMARTANVVNLIRTAKGASNVLLVDAGDEMQGSLLSNVGDGTPTGKGYPTIDVYNKMGYAVATFGNHEFDWGQPNLIARMNQATYPYVSANIVLNDTGNCATATWATPSWIKGGPFQVLTVGTAPNTVKVAFIGVTTTETPTITIAAATTGLCFMDPQAAIMKYWAAMKSQADVIVVLSHLGYTDGGYGYGLPVIGDQTLATNLIKADMPVDLIIGGHSHTSIAGPGTIVTVSGKTAKTTVAQAAYNGRRVGEADITVGTDGAVSVSWKAIYWRTPTAPATTPAANWRISVGPTPPADADFADSTQDPTINSVITAFASDPAYLALVNTPVGYSAVDLPRNGGLNDNMMATFIDDAIYNYLNSDADVNNQPITANDIDIFFNNAGGIRTDWCWDGTAWATTGCVAGTHAAGLLTYGNMFTILPFGNATVVGTMTGAQILEVLNYGPKVSNGVIQPAGLKYKFFAYKDALAPGSASSLYTYAWGAFDYCVVNKVTKLCEPLDLNKTYRVGTNEFLAPAGGDGYAGFKYMTNISYWGDMLNAVNAYVNATYTAANPYKGPNGDGSLDGRVVRDGDNTGGSIIPITILHHNDSHGNLAKGTFAGYTQLATLIKQERAHNPTRTLLLSGGDNIQGDSMMYYFKSAPLGYAADLTPLTSPPQAVDLTTHPMMAVMNSMNYDAMDLGNHEFNFGSEVFKGIMGQANFPILGANVSDDGQYGLASAQGGAGVKPFIEKTLGGVKIAILGITNHRVPNYELPSNIVGLTFSNPITTGQQYAPQLKAANDVVIALTHIGFTTNPKSVEVDNNVDTNFAMAVPGIDAIIGSHSHTNPASPETPYKQLPTYVGYGLIQSDPSYTPVIINQAYRYNNTLGEVIIGVRAKVGAGYEVVSRAGQYLSVSMSSTSPTPEDTATKNIVAPYVTVLNAYNNTVIGQTTEPIDTRNAYVAETNAANMQADASVHELNANGIYPDIHLSGAMTRPSSPNDLMFPTATTTNPQTMKVVDMFTLMPYENSLVVLKMNGPQLKTVLERAYRNYFYYNYYANADPKYGGYSYYTTCMLDTNSIGRIYYKDTAPALPGGNNVMGLIINGKAVDFNDAATFYKVSTVNYLAAGSCNFNDGGVSLWPLNQIANDTQFYVRDAVIHYVQAMGTVSPKVEGRLLFGDATAPVVTIKAPMAMSYLHPDFLKLDFSAVDGVDGTTPSLAAPSGVKTLVADLDGMLVTNGQVIDLYTLSLGSHNLKVTATDFYGNTSTQVVTFNVTATVQSLKTSIARFYAEGKISKADVYKGLLDKLVTAEKSTSIKTRNNALNAFINLVQAQSGKAITKEAANLLIMDAKWVIAH